MINEICVSVGNGGLVGEGDMGVKVPRVIPKQVMILMARGRDSITIPDGRFMIMKKLSQMDCARPNYLAFPWFATASAALVTASGSPR